MINEEEITMAVKIPFDEERVKREKVYDLDKMKNRLNLLFLNAHLNIQVPGYMFTNNRGQSKEKAAPDMWATIGYLKRCRWLMKSAIDMQVFVGGYEDLKANNYESIFESMKRIGSFYDRDKYWWPNES